jgi:hypothetical protein
MSMKKRSVVSRAYLARLVRLRMMHESDRQRSSETTFKRRWISDSEVVFVIE